MASFFTTGNSTTPQTLAAGENGFVAASGTLYTETATAVSIGSIAGDHGLNVQGTVATATGVAAVRTTNSTSANIDIIVGTQGSITSTATDAIRLSVTNSFTLRNAGLISGQDTGLFVQGVTSGRQFVTIANSGTIEGGDTVIEFGDGVDSVDFTNSGTLMATSGSRLAIFLANGDLRLDNSGEINGGVTTDTLFLQNDGTILGRVTAFGDDSFGTHCIIQNAGTIGAIRCDGFGEISNFGTILSAIDIFAGQNSNVFNAGLVGAGVILSSSSDTFTNEGGTVFGRIDGWGGDDIFNIDRGDLRINGGTGIDTVNSTASYKMGSAVEVLNLLGAEGLAGLGREGNETIRGGSGDDTLGGRSGNDFLDGGEGNDLAEGGRGDDVLSVSDGTDTLDGGSGTDTLFLTGPQARHVVNLAAGTWTEFDPSGDVAASAVLARIENVDGTLWDDQISGSAADNRLVGLQGNDTIDGANGADTLDGGLNDDRLSGGGGEDVLIGGAGRDTMTGGAQADTFVFNTVSDSEVGLADLITDFERQRDILDLSAIDADPVAVGDQSFTFLGTLAFSGNGAQVRFQQDAVANTTTVQLRFTGDSVTDMEIVLTGLVNLTVTNLIL